MKDKKAMTTTLIRAVIAVAVLAVMIWGGVLLYSKLYSGFKDWNSLSESEQQSIKNDFQNFVESIKECKDTKDNFCRCENVFANFPNSFVDEVSLEVLQESVNFYMTLGYNKNQINNTKTDMGMGKLFFVEEGGNEAQEIRKGDSELKITFDKEYPEVEGIEKHEIASGDIFRRDFSNVLYFIIDDKSFFDEYPKCVYMRTDALNLFDSFIDKLKTDDEMIINLPEDYRIFYGEKVIQLKHNEEEIERIYDKSGNKLEKRTAAREIYDFNVKCNKPLKADYILSGDKIKVIRERDGFCIEKAVI